MATILERIQEAYDADGLNDARNIAEALAIVRGKGGRGANSIADALSLDITLTFDPNGGTGKAFTMIVTANLDWTVPECPFTPPDGKVFDYWWPIETGSEFPEQAREWFIPGANTSTAQPESTTFYAIWKDAE